MVVCVDEQWAMESAEIQERKVDGSRKESQRFEAELPVIQGATDVDSSSNLHEQGNERDGWHSEFLKVNGCSR